jgi:archaetidylinositol phosphate synthase
MSKNQKYGGIEKHKRVNDILMGPLERPALAYLVKITPSWVSPDMLTIFGFLAGILIGVSYLLTNLDKNFLWLANLGFVLNWLGDSLDGNLARYRKIERPRYGFFIDHAVDIITEVFIFLGLAFSPYVDFKIAILALIAYLCMTNLVFLITSVEGVFQISYGRLGPTEARIIAMSANTIIFFVGNPQIQLPFAIISLYNLILIGVIILLTIFFTYTTISHGIALSRSDRAL